MQRVNLFRRTCPLFVFGLGVPVREEILDRGRLLMGTTGKLKNYFDLSAASASLDTNIFESCRVTKA